MTAARFGKSRHFARRLPSLFLAAQPVFEAKDDTTQPENPVLLEYTANNDCMYKLS